MGCLKLLNSLGFSGDVLKGMSGSSDFLNENYTLARVYILCYKRSWYFPSSIHIIPEIRDLAAFIRR